MANIIEPNWFSGKYWLQQQAVTGQSRGRNVTYFVATENEPKQPLTMVLRHYYRGGLVSKVNRDAFLYTGFDNTRAVAELVMLEKMQQLKLPVPTPIAAMVTKNPLSPFYRCDILIETINGAKDGFQILSESTWPEAQWQTVGKTIRQFHNNNVYHSDLNIHNIMIDKNGIVYLIDFDRCEFRNHNDSWKQQNLARLLRSLHKELNKNSDFNFESQHWQWLLAGYNG